MLKGRELVEKYRNQTTKCGRIPKYAETDGILWCPNTCSDSKCHTGRPAYLQEDCFLSESKQERKHLKLEAFTQWGVTLMRIIEQTHKGETFGLKDRRFSAKDGFLLISYDYPKLGKKNLLYLRGSCEERDEEVVVVFDPTKMSKLRVAIHEYNLAFGGDEKKQENVEIIE